MPNNRLHAITAISATTAATTAAITAATLALAACNTSSMPAASPIGAPSTAMSGNVNLRAQLTGAAEVPVVAGNGTGTVDVSLNPNTNVATWTITYSGLTGLVTDAHFHGPAMAGQNAGAVVPITGSLQSPITGSARLSVAEAADLWAGKWYLNLHTGAHPNGEVRGQVVVRP